MSWDRIFVSVAGGGLILFIYWFFFVKKEEVQTAEGKVNITVDGGYNPSVIKVKKNQSTTLNITRKDPNSCLEEIILPDFKIKEYLPLNKNIRIQINPEKNGEFPFHCGMNMFHGKIVVD